MSNTEIGRLDQVMETARQLRAGTGRDISDRIVAAIYGEAEAIAGKVVSTARKPGREWDRYIDDLITSRWLGFPVMLALLGVVFWITLAGANYPSQLLATALFRLQDQLTVLFTWMGAPEWLHGVVVLGMYQSTAWVVSVMLPPMAIFFPLFTLLEDLGYLPRVAFNLDHVFKKAGAHGKQALTMSMGFGCNAAGVTACRIIESPREKLIAMLTNNFVPCNGRFPLIIAMASILTLGPAASLKGSAAAAGTVVMVVLVGITATLMVSLLLSRTILKGVPSSFALELPPYRKPQIGRILVRSVLDRTVFVLGRALVLAAPAGVVTWVMANVKPGDVSLLERGAGFLEPLGGYLGLDGFILMAFILGFPANELVIPLLIMGYLSAGTMIEPGSMAELKTILVEEHGWTWLTAVCMMLFSLLHYPCGTTLLTINRETRSIKWTLVAFLLPLSIACLACFLVARLAAVLGF